MELALFQVKDVGDDIRRALGLPLLSIVNVVEAHPANGIDHITCVHARRLSVSRAVEDEDLGGCRWRERKRKSEGEIEITWRPKDRKGSSRVLSYAAGVRLVPTLRQVCATRARPRPRATSVAQIDVYSEPMA